VSKAAENQQIARVFAKINSIIEYFRGSNTRSRQLENAILARDPKATKTKLERLNPTRWVGRHSSVNTFFEAFTAIVDALQSLSKTDHVAKDLLASISRFSFVYALIAVGRLSVILKHLGTVAQKIDIDLISLHEEVESVAKYIAEVCDISYHEGIFSDAEELCKLCDIHTGLAGNETRGNQDINQLTHATLLEYTG
jgi:hypothetical protein